MPSSMQFWMPFWRRETFLKSTYRLPLRLPLVRLSVYGRPALGSNPPAAVRPI
jgi:hypothetical protein